MPKKFADQVVGSADGRVIAWDEGQFSGDPDLVADALYACSSSASIRPFSVDPAVFIADASTPTGAVAAMMYAAPGRMVILRMPDSVQRLFSLLPEENDSVV